MLAASTLAVAQPTMPKTVTIITSLPVGSGPDSVIRRVAKELSAKWNSNVIIENKPGGAGIVSLNAFNNTPSDGSAIYFGTADSYSTLSYLNNRADDYNGLEPIMGMLKTDMMLITGPNIKTLEQLKQAVRKKPTFGSWGIASQAHIDGAILVKLLGANPVHVPYKDYGAWMVDISNGELPFSFTSVGSSRQLKASGKLNYLAVLGDKRDPRYPDVPTINEFLGQKMEYLNPFMIVYTKESVPTDIKAHIHSSITSAMASPDVVESLDTIGFLPWSVPGSFNKYLQDYKSNYIKFIKTKHVEIQQ